MRFTFQEWLPRIVVAPIFLLSLSFIYGLMIWNGYLSLSASRMLPNYEFVGLRNYFDLFASDRFRVAMTNIVVFGLLYVSGTIALGVCLAIMLDQKIRAEGVLRSIYLFPMAISFIVTGTAWRWIFNPGVGIESVVRGWGFESFTFDWITRSETALYCIVIAGIWQGAGFVMALFLAGLRGVDDSILKAAVIDGATRFRTYTRIVLPMLRPVFFSAAIIVTHLAIKAFDLVVALTDSGPGYSTDLPATFFFTTAFDRNQIGVAASSAVVMLCMVASIAVPFMYSELRARPR